MTSKSLQKELQKDYITIKNQDFEQTFGGSKGHGQKTGVNPSPSAKFDFSNSKSNDINSQFIRGMKNNKTESKLNFGSTSDNYKSNRNRVSSQ